jgi:leucyl aminopeptidase (aminopeptidase T)
LSSQKPELYINLLRGVREETPFRVNLIQLETRYRKSRLGHCPGVTLDMLTDGALALTMEEHKEMQNFARTLIKALDQTTTVEINSPKGTSLELKTNDRPFFTDTIIDWKEMKWMNLPTGEVIVAPLENSMNGTLNCDLAVGGIGVLNKPVEFLVENGIVDNIHSEDKKLLQIVDQSLKTDNWANVVGEFAFGINPKARFTNEFLELEKILGTIHIAFGNNTDMPGGRNPSKNHIDLLISKPTVKITKNDGTKKIVMEDGEFQEDLFSQK